MKRQDLESYIEDTFSAKGEYLFEKNPTTCVFRHANNNKWFAVIMEIPKRTLGIPEEGSIVILNTKCDFILINSFLQEPGFFPAYHMNKTHWISTAIDGSVPDGRIMDLLDISYDMTSIKRKKNKE